MDSAHETVTAEQFKFIWLMCKHPVRTAQQTHSVSVIKTNQLMLCREITAVCSESHTKHVLVNTLCG